MDGWLLAVGAIVVGLVVGTGLIVGADVGTASGS
jgi:hypothetical protein